MFHNVLSLFAAFSLLLIKVWAMIVSRQAEKLGRISFPSGALPRPPAMMSHKISHKSAPATHPGQVLPTVGAFQSEVQCSLEWPRVF